MRALPPAWASANHALRAQAAACDAWQARIPQKRVPVLLRNQVYADCVDLSAAEYAQISKRLQAARMLERNASISERSTSASRRSSPEALSTSLAADPAWDDAVETPMMLLETSDVPPAAVEQQGAATREIARNIQHAAAIAVVTSLISPMV